MKREKRKIYHRGHGVHREELGKFQIGWIVGVVPAFLNIRKTKK